MPKKIKPRVVRVDDFIAEGIEAEAKRIPKSDKVMADLLRKSAKLFRNSKNPKMIRVWEEEDEDFAQTAFRTIQETIRRSES